MEMKDISTIVRPIIRDVPTLVAKGRMLVATPVDEILRAFYFDDSSFNKDAFYVWAFVQPLYVPATTIGFNIGKRLLNRAGERWNTQQFDIQDELFAVVVGEGMSFLETFKTPMNLVKRIREMPAATDPYVMQAYAYSLIAASRADEAKAALTRMVERFDVKISWMAEMVSRANSLIELLSHDPRSAYEQLSTWQQETAINLGIDALT